MLRIAGGDEFGAGGRRLELTPLGRFSGQAHEQ
jgi:hypothetical protein